MRVLLSPLLLLTGACAAPQPLALPPAQGGWFGEAAAQQSALEEALHHTLQGVVQPEVPCTGTLRVELREAPGGVQSGLITAVTAGTDGRFTLLAPPQEGLVLTAACEQGGDGAPTPGEDLVAEPLAWVVGDAAGLTLRLARIPAPAPPPPLDPAPGLDPAPAGPSFLESAPRLGDPSMMRRGRAPGGLRPPSLGAPSGG